MGFNQWVVRRHNERVQQFINNLKTRQAASNSGGGANSNKGKKVSLPIDVASNNPPPNVSNVGTASIVGTVNAKSEFPSLKELMELQRTNQLNMMQAAHQYRMAEAKPQTDLEHRRITSNELLTQNRMNMEERVETGRQGVQREDIASRERVGMEGYRSAERQQERELGFKQQQLGQERELELGRQGVQREDIASRERVGMEGYRSAERQQDKQLDFSRWSQIQSQDFQKGQQERELGFRREQLGQERELELGRQGVQREDIASRERVGMEGYRSTERQQEREIGYKEREGERQRDFSKWSQLSSQEHERGLQGDLSRYRQAEAQQAADLDLRREGVVHGYKKELMDKQFEQGRQSFRDEINAQQERVESARQAAANLFSRGHFRRMSS